MSSCRDNLIKFLIDTHSAQEGRRILWYCDNDSSSDNENNDDGDCDDDDDIDVEYCYDDYDIVMGK